MLVNFLKPRIARWGIRVPFDVSLPRRNPRGRACRKIINRGRAGNRQRRHSFLISELYRELSEKVEKYQTVSKLRIARRQASWNFRFLSARSRLPPDSADSRLPGAKLVHKEKKKKKEERKSSSVSIRKCTADHLRTCRRNSATSRDSSLSPVSGFCDGAYASRIRGICG